MSEPRIEIAGDQALMVVFGQGLDPRLHRRVRSLAFLLERQGLPGMVEYVPSFTGVTVYYDPGRVELSLLLRRLEELIETLPRVEVPPPRLIELPVCYGGEWGPDLLDVANYHGMSPEEVVRLHSRPRYLVYMLGFAPGLPYLGGLPPELAIPRRKEPRLAVPAGSVGIGGIQAAVYPTETPGGFHILGRTPVPIYNPRAEDPVLFRAGDLVRFRPIGPEEYAAIAAQVEAGAYRVSIRTIEEDERD